MLRVITLIVLFSIAGSIPADDAVNEHGQRSVMVSELPAPPADLALWVRAGDVSFLIGGERPSVVDPARSTGTIGRTFDAETQFRLSYTFKSRCRWDWVDDPDTQRLAIGVRFDRLQLVVKHRVWLRELPEADKFWDSPLVRHEFDHVRLSSDPRVKALFIEAVSRRERLELTIEQSGPLITLATRRQPNRFFGNPSLLNFLTGDDAQPWVDAAVQAEFDNIVQLVEIRYQELDRQTDHGRRPVPSDGELSEWLAVDGR